eukprot:m.126497 g.126497  ORF g.126497 m.126497 type:complete len:580 (+) comp12994_c3_seq3:276-2015(+)
MTSLCCIPTASTEEEAQENCHPHYPLIDKHLATSQHALASVLKPNAQYCPLFGAGYAIDFGIVIQPATTSTTTSSAVEGTEQTTSKDKSGLNYFEREDPYQFRLYIPVDYPNTAPSIFSKSIVRHSQLLPSRFVPDDLVNFWIVEGMALYPGTCMDEFELDRFDEHNYIAACILLCYSMLHLPVPEAPTALDNEEDLSGLMQEWKRHPAECGCFFNQCMPCSYAEYEATHTIDAKMQLLKTFHRTFSNRHHYLYLSSAKSHKAMLQCRDAWQEKSKQKKLFVSQQVAHTFHITVTDKGVIASKEQRDMLQFILDERLFAALFHINSKEDLNHEASPSSSPLLSSRLRELVRKEGDGVFSIPLFNSHACDCFDAEVQMFREANIPHLPPNSMNRYGAVLDDIGMESLFDIMTAALANPIWKAFFHMEGDGVEDLNCDLDSHHCFVIQYRPEEDRSLDMHTDDSELTINVNLCDRFEGSGLNFCGVRGRSDHRKHSLQYVHEKGRAAFHRGTLRHGAEAITNGYRSNLVMWFHSNRFRTTPAYIHSQHRNTNQEEDPDRVCLSRTHDPDYDMWVNEYQQRE